MQRTTMLQEDWWKLRAEAPWGNAPARQDVVALRAENDRLRRALAGRSHRPGRGRVMVPTCCSRGATRDLLVDISRQCNTKPPEVAAAVVAAWAGKPLPERMQRMQRTLRRALRRFHVENQRCDSRPPGGSSR